jgi:hypothetical protein
MSSSRSSLLYEVCGHLFYPIRHRGTEFRARRSRLNKQNHQWPRCFRECSAWQRRASALTEFKHINKHVFVRMGKKCTPASGSSTLPRRTRPKAWNIFSRSNDRIEVSNFTRGIYVCPPRLAPCDSADRPSSAYEDPQYHINYDGNRPQGVIRKAEE